LQYVDFVQITPASCAPPGGDIMFELSSPGGQLNIVVTLEGNTQTFTTDAGNFLLSDQMLTSAGDYDFQIFPVTAGDTCAEVFTLTIPDENVPLFAVNDTFQTAVNTPLTANMLANDQGNGLRVVLVVDEINGTIVHEENGDFTFTPNPGFTGVGFFDYAVEDACGGTDFARCTIQIAQPIAEPGTTLTVGVTSLGGLPYPATPELPGPSVMNSIGSSFSLLATFLNWQRNGRQNTHRLLFEHAPFMYGGQRLLLTAQTGKNWYTPFGDVLFLLGPAVQLQTGMRDGLPYQGYQTGILFDADWSVNFLPGLNVQGRLAWDPNDTAPPSWLFGLRYGVKW
ncbi:MAG: Ig-like domain-containing protein, partial [Bacteroidota bacterium]